MIGKNYTWIEKLHPLFLMLQRNVRQLELVLLEKSQAKLPVRWHSQQNVVENSNFGCDTKDRRCICDIT